MTWVSAQEKRKSSVQKKTWRTTLRRDLKALNIFIISDYENGGLKLLDLNSVNKTLKLFSVRKYLNDDSSSKCKLLFDF